MWVDIQNPLGLKSLICNEPNYFLGRLRACTRLYQVKSCTTSISGHFLVTGSATTYWMLPVTGSKKNGTSAEPLPLEKLILILDVPPPNSTHAPTGTWFIKIVLHTQLRCEKGGMLK